jgi:5-methylcytosine-specific restriction enzyme A
MTDGYPARSWQGSTRRKRLPSNWTELRKQVRERANGICQWSGCYSKGTECDHIVPGDDHSPENLQWLCWYHHRVKTGQETGARNMAKPRIRRTEEKHPGLL